MSLKIELQPYQFDFIYSQARHPAFVGGWGVGKTLCAISRAMTYSDLIPDNLGVIFRKTAKSLFDSTLKDFEKYTRLKVNHERNCKVGDSMVMFRHIDEIGDINQQNLNLGWFYIEQGEELETDKEFFMLWGRLRRELKPSPEFLKLGLPLRSGWVIANAGDHWMKPLWKDKKLEGAHLVEATTWDNAKNLPQDFLDSLRALEKTKPELYRQFVMNDWSVGADAYCVIRPVMIDSLRGVVHDPARKKKVISCDPSQGGDACVIMVFENTKVIEKLRLHVDDTMKIVGELMILSSRHHVNDIAVDAIGIGAGICDRLQELGKNVIRIQSAEKASNDIYANRRSEMWFYLAEQIQKREIEYFEDEKLRKQMTAVRYDPKAVNSQGFMKLVPKQETKKVLGESPDDADCYVYGIWALREVNYFEEPESYGTFGFERKKRIFSGAGGW